MRIGSLARRSYTLHVGFSSRYLRLFHWQTVQVADGALCVRSGGEDCSLVLSQDVQPVCQVSRVILTRLRRNA